MSSQKGVQAGRAHRDDAMARVEDAANEAWRAEALQAVYETAVARQQFIVDDVMDQFVAKHGFFATSGTHDLRAMGPVMMRAKAQGWIEATAAFGQSHYPGHHATPRRVWKSQIYAGQVGTVGQQEGVANGRA